MLIKRLSLFVLVLFLAGCSAPGPAAGQPSVTAPTAAATSVQATAAAPSTPAASSSTATAPAPAKTDQAPTLAPTEARPSETQAAADWKTLPVVPAGVSDTVLAIYQRGVKLGNKPDAFSKVGDCETSAYWFMGDFDAGTKYYSLGDYEADLKPVIDYYHGSFDRRSLAAKPAFTAASVLSNLWADPEKCQKNESALACEYRLNKPSVALIMLGTNDVPHKENFEPNMRKVIEFTIQQGIIPVLATKPDNLEKDGSLNATIARLAAEYDIPLWNFWASLQNLPKKGLQDDGAHLTVGPNNFSDKNALMTAWTQRNLTGLQILKVIMDSVSQ